MGTVSPRGSVTGASLGADLGTSRGARARAGGAARQFIKGEEQEAHNLQETIFSR